MKILGGIVEGVVYKGGLKCAVLSPGRKGVCDKLNVYLNPNIKPGFVKPEGKEIMSVEGEFLPQDGSIFSPTLIIERSENGLIAHKLCFD